MIHQDSINPVPSSNQDSVNKRGFTSSLNPSDWKQTIINIIWSSEFTSLLPYQFKIVINETAARQVAPGIGLIRKTGIMSVIVICLRIKWHIQVAREVVLVIVLFNNITEEEIVVIRIESEEP